MWRDGSRHPGQVPTSSWGNGLPASGFSDPQTGQWVGFTPPKVEPPPFAAAAAAARYGAAAGGAPSGPLQFVSTVPFVGDHPQPQGGHEYSAATGATAPAPTAASGYLTLEERAAKAREKNRIAQQRFRGKERKRMEEAQEQADRMADEIGQLKLENERLQLEHSLMSKTLTWRTAMLALVNRLDPVEEGQSSSAPVQQQQQQRQQQQRQQQQRQQQQQQGAGGAAGWGGGAGWGGDVAETLDEVAAVLAELEPLQQMVGLGGETSGHGQAQARSPDGRSSSEAFTLEEEGEVEGEEELEQAASCAGPTHGAAPTGGSRPVNAPGFAGVVAAAASLDVQGAPVERRFLELGKPAPTKPAALNKLKELSPVGLRQYWLGWKERVTAAYEAAEASGFSEPTALARMQEELGDMAEVFWTVGELQPRVFNTFLLSCLAPPGADMSATWRRIAEQSLPMLSEAEIANIRVAWQRYMSRAAVQAVAAGPWVQKLRRAVAAAAGGAHGLQGLSRQHTQVAEVAARLQHACREQYMAAISFLIDVTTQTTPILRTFWHVSAGQYCPDHAAIVGEILRLHQDRRQQALLASPAGAATDGAPAGAAACDSTLSPPQ